ncbi:MAG: ribbon-helix-helix protein, CopG family [Acidobacteria bacterium]|nr:ribbon-helix-helix protein, CopG family [Acidobacteriota bacterium]
MADMVFHVKTTLTIDDSAMVRLRRQSARTGRTMSELVETALRRLLQSKPDQLGLQPLPTFKSGGALVDIADRDALYRAMEGR